MEQYSNYFNSLQVGDKVILKLSFETKRKSKYVNSFYYRHGGVVIEIEKDKKIKVNHNNGLSFNFNGQLMCSMDYTSGSIVDKTNDFEMKTYQDNQVNISIINSLNLLNNINRNDVIANKLDLKFEISDSLSNLISLLYNKTKCLEIEELKTKLNVLNGF